MKLSSFDAPPLDFANLNLKALKDLQTAIPRSGKRKEFHPEVQDVQKKEETPQDDATPVQQMVQTQEEPEERIDEEDREKERERREREKQKEQRGIPVIVRTIGQPVQQSSNVQYKPVVDDLKKTKKEFKIDLVQSSLVLSYNKISTLQNFFPVIDSIMFECQKIQWIDLSHNAITSLDYNFAEFPLLKSLYLHANLLTQISDLEQLAKLPYLRALTIHGNPLDSIQNFRLYIIGLLPNIKKIDSVLISKKELDNAVVWKNNFGMLKPPQNIKK